LKIKSHISRHPRGPDGIAILKVITALATLITLPIGAPHHLFAEEQARVQITFSKPGYGSGSGYLFYQGQKYGLAVTSPKIGRIWASSIDLIGTASNLNSSTDIIGIYNASNPEAALVRRATPARLENAKGVVLEIRAVNLGRWSNLDLSGMTLRNAGWQPSSE
jgi:hypothetical protein